MHRAILSWDIYFYEYGSYPRKPRVVYDRKHSSINNIDIIDRIGSGDAYVSGVLYGYLKYKDSRKALEYGNALAAIKHSIIGDMAITDPDEIDSIIAEHKNTGHHSEMNR